MAKVGVSFLEFQVLFHTDFLQAFGKVPVDLRGGGW